MQFFAAEAFQQLGQSERAAELYERVVSEMNAWRQPILSSRAWLRLGQIRQAAGDVAGARAAYEEVIARRNRASAGDPDRARARVELRVLDSR